MSNDPGINLSFNWLPFTPNRDFHHEPKILARAKGMLYYDMVGRPIVDGSSGLFAVAAGHGREEITQAVSRQLDELDFAPSFYRGNPPAFLAAEKLAGILPAGLDRVFLVNSGSEAVDSAMKLARVAHVLAGQPQRKLIISRVRGYHGVAYGGTSAQGIAPNREHFGPFVDDVVQVPADDLEAIATLFAQRGSEVAAVLTEPVQGAAGIYPPADGYLEGLRKLCDQHGAYLIFDEVITGYGRLGSWFAAHHYGVRPDLVTFAKAVTSGYQPLGGVFVGPAPRAALESDTDFFLRHGFTYSGHASACAAGLANLTILRREGLVERAAHVGARLRDGLAALAADGAIDHTRGEGAMWAAGLRPDQNAVVLRDRMLAAGVITRAINTDTLTFCPPLVITDVQIDRIVDALATAVAAG